MAKGKKRLGEILVDWGLLEPSAVTAALEHASRNRMRIGEALVALGSVSEDDVAKALASQFDMEYRDLERNPIESASISLIPEDIIRRHFVLPIERRDSHLKVVITDPLDLETLDSLRFRLNVDIECCLASLSKVKAVVKAHFEDQTQDTLDGTISDLTQMGTQMGETLMGADLQGSGRLGPDEEESSAPIVKLVTAIITSAVQSRASDIHIEPMANRVRVRYRIDGVCIERESIPKRMQNSVISRLKIMSGMQIEVKRIPQDGRIKMTVGAEEIDFRVSALPGYHGESLVLRILRPESAQLGIEALGFEPDDKERFDRIIRRPNGIFLVTGPTGSGKTTTLYGALNTLNRPDVKIITAEDPVEYNFPGMNQCEVHEEIGRTFSIILRSMLRQAPNIILVGEIRDYEVAEVAMAAALTGHLVFSTLHTNDAPSAITRLLDMGVKPFLVSSSVQAVMAQRLIRTICENCREEYKNADHKFLKLLGFSPEEIETATLQHGAGCDQCSSTGYRGRQGIFEMFVMNGQLRDLTFRRASLSELRQAAKASGMKSLLEDGRRKVLRGVTTPEEVARVTVQDIEVLDGEAS